MPIQDLDLYEIGELASECLYALLKPCKIAFDMRPQQLLHAVIGELRFQLVNRASRIAEQASECSTDAGLGPAPSSTMQ